MDLFKSIFVQGIKVSQYLGYLWYIIVSINVFLDLLDNLHQLVYIQLKKRLC